VLTLVLLGFATGLLVWINGDEKLLPVSALLERQVRHLVEKDTWPELPKKKESVT